MLPKEESRKEEPKNWKKHIVMNHHQKETTTENIGKILLKQWWLLFEKMDYDSNILFWKDYTIVAEIMA